MPGDPYTAPPPSRPFADEVGADPGRLRIGWRTSEARWRCARRDCVSAVEHAVATLTVARPSRSRTTPFPELDALPPAAAGIFGTVVARDLDRWGERSGSRSPRTMSNRRPGSSRRSASSLGSPDFIALVELAQRWTREAASLVGRRQRHPGHADDADAAARARVRARASTSGRSRCRGTSRASPPSPFLCT